MLDLDPAIAVLPYGTKLGLRPGTVPLDKLNWPLGRPTRLMGKTLADLTEVDHLIRYPSNVVHIAPQRGTRASVSLMVVEPEAIHGRHFKKLQKSFQKFYRVFSSNEKFLGSVPNGIFLAFGTTWVSDWASLEIEKTEMLSLIASAKKSQEGHLLRHEIVDWIRTEQIDASILGGGYQPFERKSEGLAKYRYSVVIENVRERNYFTEKLIDALLCETIPIYWGCPNIADFFETEGMVVCDTASDIQNAIEKMSAGDYERRHPALSVAKRQAITYADLELRAAEEIRATLQG